LAIKKRSTYPVKWQKENWWAGCFSFVFTYVVVVALASEQKAVDVQRGFSIQSFQNGDQQAFNFIFACYYRSLCYFAGKFIPVTSIAEDITQESFVRLWEKHDAFSCQHAIKTFLYIVTRNACLNFLKQWNRDKKNEDKWRTTYDETEESLLPDLTRSEELKGILTAVEELPAECRKVIQLCFIEGYENQEIARQLHLSVHTIKNQKARGLYLLKKRFLRGY
jgi:RNA polymerase sigma-70 factor (family 1)